jgi:hypothetical protein
MVKTDFISNIFLITAFYTIFFYLLSFMSDKLFPAHKDDKNKMVNLLKLTFEVVLEMGIYCSSIYLLKPQIDHFINDVGFSEKPHAIAAAAVCVSVATTPWKSNIGARMSKITDILNSFFP